MVATVKKDRIYNREASGNFQIACTRWAPDYADPTTFLKRSLQAVTQTTMVNGKCAVQLIIKTGSE